MIEKNLPTVSHFFFFFKNIADLNSYKTLYYVADLQWYVASTVLLLIVSFLKYLTAMIGLDIMVYSRREKPCVCQKSIFVLFSLYNAGAGTGPKEVIYRVL